MKFRIRDLAAVLITAKLLMEFLLVMLVEADMETEEITMAVQFVEMIIMVVVAATVVIQEEVMPIRIETTNHTIVEAADQVMDIIMEAMVAGMIFMQMVEVGIMITLTGDHIVTMAATGMDMAMQVCPSCSILRFLRICTDLIA